MIRAGAPTRADRPSFDDFFAGELASLESLAFGLTGRHVLAEELAQEAMLVVYRRWETIARYEDPAAFARRVVMNKSVSAFRRLLAEGRALNRFRSRPAPTIPSWGAPDEELWAAVRRLPPRQAQAVTMRYVADLDTAQIAAVLQCEPGAVRVLLHRARRTLAATLGRGDGEVTDEP